MNQRWMIRRWCSFVLTLTMLLPLCVPAFAAEEDGGVSFRRVDDERVTASLLDVPDTEKPADEAAYADTDQVRVSIVLDSLSTIDMGYPVTAISENSGAMNYRRKLVDIQQNVTKKIEYAIGDVLDVQWNLTLAVNLISAFVEYGQISVIERIPGVEKVLIEPQYSIPEPIEAADEETASPQTYSSTDMIGMTQVWDSGYTGAGMRVAIVDTGLDIDHQSFDEDAYLYALLQNALGKDIGYDAYLESLNLLDAEEIERVLENLNVMTKAGTTTAEKLYRSAKIPFAFNYIDSRADYVTHDRDSMTDHGSHVAGIAAANRYIQTGTDTYADAESTCKVVGAAPDAQIIVMKVFGMIGGAYASDYVAAIEDAITLGADSVNLSLGTPSSGFSNAGEYQEFFESLTLSDTVVAISAGNEYNAIDPAYNSTFLKNGYLYADSPVYPSTVGSPASYTNSLAVASVNNKRNVLNGYFSILTEDGGDALIPQYNETLYNNMKALTTLDTSADGKGTEYEYVFLTTNGYESNYDFLDVEGKIVFCSRGDIAFYEKATIAADQGALATIIYNNTAGTYGMDMTSYTYENPAVSITMDVGEQIRKLSKQAMDDDNQVYYTGSMKIVRGQITVSDGKNYYTMSDFSSWGTTGDLALKPEITAPGGNIYSVRGDAAATNLYKTNSGTSMAAPQITGAAAITAQFIEKTGFGSGYGFTKRQLGQSLMMSTAVPLKDANGKYYPVIKQGAGMVSGSAIVGADSFIMMHEDATVSYADGKIKAELGDDPERNGVYTFSFTIYNEADTDRTFAMSADVFTQDVFEDITAEGWNTKTYYSKQSTTDLASAAVFLENGVAQTDGMIDVEANASTEVKVRIILADDAKKWLDTYYPNGAYVQAYVYAEPQGGSEGAVSSSHSIPVLGFYGSWTDASMYDSASYANGEVISIYNSTNTTDDSRVSYSFRKADEIESRYGENYLIVTSAKGENYILGGNPLVKDAVYKPERNAVSNGTYVVQWRYILFRDAAYEMSKAENLTSGTLYYKNEKNENTLSTYYDKNNVCWQYWSKDSYVYQTLPEAAQDDLLKFSLITLPEYYMEGKPGENAEYGAGAELSITAVVDETIPLVERIAYNRTNGTLSVTASDNNYVSAVVLYNETGSEILSYTGADLSAAKGEAAVFTVDPSGHSESTYLLQVFDYAMNVCTYYIELDESEVVYSGSMISYDMETRKWVQVDKHADILASITGQTKVYTAAAAVGDVVYAIAYGSELHALAVSDTAVSRVIGDTGEEIVDLAYNAADGDLYGVTAESLLVRINMDNARAEVIGSTPVNTNTLACDADGVFYSNEYGSGKVYAYTMDSFGKGNVQYDFDGDGILSEADCQALLDLITGKRMRIEYSENSDLDGDGDTDTYDAYLLMERIPSRAKLICTIPLASKYLQSMEADPNSGRLYWASYCTESISGIEIGFSVLYEIDPETGEYIRYDDMWEQLTGLCVLDKDVGRQFAPVGSVADLTEADRDKLYKYEDAPEQAAIASIAGVDNSQKAELLAEETETDEVTITLTSENRTTNGHYTVEYNADTMTLLSAEGFGELNSIMQEEGHLAYAYVSTSPVPAGGSLAVLTFAVADCDSEVVITCAEENDTHPETKTTAGAGAHDWSSWTEIQEADCSGDGMQERSCSICKRTEQKTIPSDENAHKWGGWIQLQTASVNHPGLLKHTCKTCGLTVQKWAAAAASYAETIDSFFNFFTIGQKRITSAQFYGAAVNTVSRLQTNDGSMRYIVELSDKTAFDAVLSGHLQAAKITGSGYGIAIRKNAAASLGWAGDELDYTITLENGTAEMTAYSYTASTTYTELHVYFFVGTGGKAYADPTYLETPGAVSKMGIWSETVDKVYWEEGTDDSGRTQHTGYIWLAGDTPADAAMELEFVSSHAVYEGTDGKGDDIVRCGLTAQLVNGAASVSFVSGSDVYTLHIRNYINEAPGVYAAAGQDRVQVNTDYTVDLSKIFYDRNGDVLCYTVSVNGGKGAAVGEICTVIPDTAGTMTLVFTASDGYLTSVPYTLTLTVTEPLETVGDINGDGVISMKDVTALMRYLVGGDEEINPEAADTNGDGVINMKDATHLCRWLLDWDVTLG